MKLRLARQQAGRAVHVTADPQQTRVALSGLCRERAVRRSPDRNHPAATGRAHRHGCPLQAAPGQRLRPALRKKLRVGRALLTRRHRLAETPPYA